MIMNCYHCNKYIINNNTKLTCSICGNTHHVKCIIKTNNMFRSMSIADKNNWMCLSCIDLFPFNQCLDESSFLQLTTNMYTQRLFIPQNYNAMLFDPFQLQSNSSHNNWDDQDPDIHYYATKHNLTNLCNSEYYDIENFIKASSNMKSPTTLSLIHSNIRSASKNADNMSTFLMSLKLKFDISL